MTILVTGGAGYIGRHVVRALAARGESVAVVDLPGAEAPAGVPVLGVDLAEPDAARELAHFVRASGVSSIVHLAARKRVDESIARPAWYRAQNVGGLRSVLDAARATGVDRLVFSSTAAVYASSETPATEADELAPANPYGETKLEGERLVEEFAREAGAHAASLRYFNVAGADDPSLAEREAHNLIPLVVERLVEGEPPVIFGGDYDTPDGTCIRDFVHVADLADSHLAVLDALAAGPAYRVYNVGTGEGASVLQVVDRLAAISGISIEPHLKARRAGDPAVVVADPSRIRDELGWTARRDLDAILTSAWEAAVVRRT